jgi:hypothetical protein
MISALTHDSPSVQPDDEPREREFPEPPADHPEFDLTYADHITRVELIRLAGHNDPRDT